MQYYNPKSDKTLTLKQYTRLAEEITNPEDIDISSARLLPQWFVTDSDWDKHYGRMVQVEINNGVKLKWFEIEDRLIAYIALGMLNEIGLKIKISQLLSDRLAAMNLFRTKPKWDNRVFVNAWKKFNSAT